MSDPRQGLPSASGIRRVTREEYNRIEAVNFSVLKHILRSPAHYLSATTDPEPDDPARFAVGNLCHAMVLEGKDLRDLYAIKPQGMSFATKDGKEWRRTQTLPIITQDDAEGMPRMAARIAKDADARALIAGCCHREFCIEFTFEGESFKSLLDMWGPLEDKGWAALGDYKTTIDCRLECFAKRVDQLDYDLQMAIYIEALKSLGFDDVYPFWIAQEKTKPYEVQTYKPTGEMLSRGMQKLRYCVGLLKQCKASGEWPGYGAGIKMLGLPKWTKEIAWGRHAEGGEG